MAFLSPLKAVWDGGAGQYELEGRSGGENDVCPHCFSHHLSNPCPSCFVQGIA